MSDQLAEVETRCLQCLKLIDRILPDPIPEGTEVSWAEGMIGKALYCQSCFDLLDARWEVQK